MGLLLGLIHKDSSDKIKGPTEAYNDFTNHGLTKSNDNGKATMTIDCPQLYGARRGCLSQTYTLCIT